MLIAIFFAATVICAIGWLCSWLSTITLLCYLEEKGCTLPNATEIKACSRKAAERMFRWKTAGRDVRSH